MNSWEVVSRVNLGEYGERLIILSVTAPGVDVLPWSCGRDHVHGGPLGCRVKEDHADVWAADCTKRLAQLRDAARVAVKRAGLPVSALWLERVWEPQKRGVPHAHIVVGANSPAELEAAQRFHAELLRRAPDYGFGKQLHISAVMTGERAARYLAGYLLGRSRKKGTIRENLGHARMPQSLIYVSRTLTRETLVTMRRLRYARWYLAARAGRVSSYPRLYGDELVDIARVAVRLERDTGPPENHGPRVLAHVRTLIMMRRRELGAI